MEIQRLYHALKTKLLAAFTPQKAQNIFASIDEAIHSQCFDGLGLPKSGGQSGYYPKSSSITRSDILAVQAVLSTRAILLQNTWLRKLEESSGHRYEILVALVKHADSELSRGVFSIPNAFGTIVL